MIANDNGNLGVAFAIIIAAGASTSVGGSIVFFPNFIKFVSPRFFAGSLGLSCGVMFYTSFKEIFNLSTQAFIDDNHDEDMAYLYATVSFFGGILTMKIVDFVLGFISSRFFDDGSQVKESDLIAPHCIGCVGDPRADLETWREMADKEVKEKKAGRTAELAADGDNVSTISRDSRKVYADDVQFDTSVPRTKDDQEIIQEMVPPPAPPTDSAMENKRLVKMGMKTCLVIILHNFPEGLVTFVATLADPRTGAAFALAIIMHNIPEGMCVSIPIYFATGDRRKAFLWSCISGVSEPFAALLGWLVLARQITQTAYGVLFGWASGMMVFICLKDILPTAHRYDPKDAIATNAVVGGMTIMALSLCLFAITA